ncbi:MAG: MBL fold metallo-hydrolase [Clostridium sp.]|nr:MBL fold metallo-hydrolase [Acetatifactor muris]MCM1527250.1 MBL fold metallo-hydrolase [Bacteroides sp.]MCM1563055.1 MBL fold metallo-hydrolase [Clostridium sp.]
MYELVQISDRCYYIDCPAKIGVCRAEGQDVWLIDSGNDKDAGRKVRQILDRNGWHLKGILNTHSNADHIGGNRYLQSQTGCKIFAGRVEKAFTEYPILEPSFLYGGFPCKDLRHKFLLAQESEVSDFEDEDFPRDIEVIPLPGHFFDMVGFRIPDGTVFLADCISSKETLDKYAVCFIYDVEAYLGTLDMVERMEASVFVPAHAAVSGDVRELVRYNRDKVHEIAEELVAACAEPISFERILQKIFERYRLTMNFEQYVLVGSTVRSYLSWLKDGGRLQTSFSDNMLLWERA